LKQVIETEAKQGDVIILKNNETYHLSEPIKLGNQNLTITAKEKTVIEQPIITWSQPNTNKYIFNSTSQGNWKISITYLTFQNANLLLIESGNALLLLDHCYVQNHNITIDSFIESTSDQRLWQLEFTLNIQITCSNFHLRNHLLLLQNQNIHMNNISISNSTISGGKVHIRNAQINTFESSMLARGVTFQSSVGDPPVISLDGVSTIIFEDLKLANNVGKMNQVTISGTKEKRSKVTLKNVVIKRCQKYLVLFSCEQCNLISSTNSSNPTYLHVSYNKLCGGIELKNCSGFINQVSLHQNINMTKTLFYMNDCVDIIIDKISASEITTVERLVHIDSRSNVRFSAMIVHNSSTDKQFLYLTINSDLIISEGIYLDNSYSCWEAIRVADSSLRIKFLSMLNSHFEQSILVYPTGKTVLVQRGIISSNVGRSTLLGVVNCTNYTMQQTKIHNNTMPNTKSCIFNAINSNAAFENINLTDNCYYTGLNIETSNVTITNVNIQNNTVTGFGKALMFYDENQIKSLIVTNLFVELSGNDRFSDENSIISMEIYKSKVIFNNVTIKLKEMTTTIVSVVHLRFANTNKNNNVDIRIQCAQNSNPHTPLVQTNKTTNFNAKCLMCPRGLYSMLGGNASIVWRNGRKSWVDGDVSHKCKICPAGGTCVNTIKSHGNYFGYLISKDAVNFIPCPYQYCCSKKDNPCTNYNTCAFRRRGVLCGQCGDNYYESYFSTKCISNDVCDKMLPWFWVLIFFTALIFTVAICFTSDIFAAIRKIFTILKSIRKEPETLEQSTYSLIASNDHQNDSTMAEKEECFTVSGVFQIFISFYQIQMLIKVQSDRDSHRTFNNSIQKMFNFEVFFKTIDELCPYKRMGAVGKSFIKDVLFIAMMLSITILAITVTAIIRSCLSRNKKKTPYQYYDGFMGDFLKLPFYQKLIVTFTKQITFSYKNFSHFVLVMLHCVDVGDKKVLYMAGYLSCHPWVYISSITLVAWVIPFPITLTISYELLKKRRIGCYMYMFCVILPPIVPCVYCWQKCKQIETFQEDNDEEIELRNCLYQFFETSYKNCSSEDHVVWWSAWFLYERFLVAVVSTIIVQPILRMCIIIPLLMILLLLHYWLKPYKKTMTFLTWLDVSSMVCLCYHASENMFRAFTYTYDISPQHSTTALAILSYLDVVFTPFTLTVLFLLSQAPPWLAAKCERIKKLQ